MRTHEILLTLYCLIVGTLLVGAGMMLWERQGRPRYRRVLRLWSIGFGLLAAGCAAAALRLVVTAPLLPAPVLSMLSNLTILAGYLTIGLGIARLARRDRRLFAVLLFGLDAALWLGWGLAHVAAMWMFACAPPICLVSLVTAWDMARNRDLAAMRSIPMVTGLFGLHGAVYLARATLLPLFAARLAGSPMELASQATMYEGVLFSMALPMLLLLLLREESHGRLQVAARTDYLTGLGNRQLFNESVPTLIATATEDRHPVLLMFDLDHFKQVNDRHGHAVGDAVLRCFAGAARNVLGPDALLVRLGGEEFAALLLVSGVAEAALLAEAVLRRFAAVPATAAGVIVPATASAGVAPLAPGSGSLAGVMREADRALYQAKASGRDRVVVASLAA